MRKDSILITGALGHIGSELIRSFEEAHNIAKIILLDNLHTCRYPSLFNLNADTELQFRQADIREDLLAIIPEDIDYVIHLAALTEPSLSAKHPKMFIEHNQDATNKIIEFCLVKNAKLIAISSTSIYSKSGKDLDELDILENEVGQTPYAQCKLIEERLITKNMKCHNLKATILRFGTIFGPSIGMRFHTAVNKFCWESSLGQPLSVWETALHQLRPYLDLNDAVSAIKFFLKKDPNFNGIFNTVTANYTVEQITDCIKRYRPQTRINLIKSPIMNDLSYTLSTDKIASLGFKFTGSLDMSVKGTLGLLSSVSSL